MEVHAAEPDEYDGQMAEMSTRRFCEKYLLSHWYDYRNREHRRGGSKFQVVVFGTSSQSPIKVTRFSPLLKRK